MLCLCEIIVKHVNKCGCGGAFYVRLFQERRELVRARGRTVLPSSRAGKNDPYRYIYASAQTHTHTRTHLYRRRGVGFINILTVSSGAAIHTYIYSYMVFTSISVWL